MLMYFIFLCTYKYMYYKIYILYSIYINYMYTIVVKLYGNVNHHHTTKIKLYMLCTIRICYTHLLSIYPFVEWSNYSSNHIFIFIPI